jgi:hypothetical protein
MDRPRFSVRAPFVEGSSVPFTIRLRNQGITYLKPLGAIEIWNMFNQPVQTVELPRWNVLPGTVRRFEAQAGGGLWPGRYSATLHADYGRNGGEILAETHFWILPWRRMALWLLARAVFGAFVWLTRKRLKAVWLRRNHRKPRPTGWAWPQ